ncbi:hypothetical protein [Vannielia sp.]|uniref:hypothetical protein n=1 Tax=Vannielia sp. TaxID=2813045 RepID=UPI00262E911C|nr:hypothetical protein [Vannielia sp.]MDF1873779.1 hypothetical protein [Vannielia sp.]
MKTPLLAATALALALSGCGSMRESRLNPFNWFGNSRSEQVQTETYEAPADPRPLVAQVAEMRIEKIPGGAILTVVGLPPTQGYWDAELVSTNPDEAPENGSLIYEFRIAQPADFQLQGAPRTREVTVGHYISDVKLQGVSRITVRGTGNQRTLRR